jgi:hypothetical protein
MLTVATLLWDKNEHSQDFSTMYNEEWVNKLYRGFSRNLTEPFRFVVYTDRPRVFCEGVTQEFMHTKTPDYGACIEAFRCDGPAIICGLDTVVTGNVDHLARWCYEADKLALPRDPYNPSIACNGVILAPAGSARVYDEWRGENDMDWCRAYPHEYLDDVFPGQVVSYKGHVSKGGLGDARIVYFHGLQKPHELDDSWIAQNWV